MTPNTLTRKELDIIEVHALDDRLVLERVDQFRGGDRKELLLRLISAARAWVDARSREQMVRHKKTGGVYRRLHGGITALLEADLTPVVIYRSEKDGTIWVRPSKEFADGRFEPLSPDQSIGGGVEGHAQPSPGRDQHGNVAGGSQGAALSENSWPQAGTQALPPGQDLESVKERLQKLGNSALEAEALAAIERLEKEVAETLDTQTAVCDSYAEENQRFHDEILDLRAKLEAAEQELAQAAREKARLIEDVRIYVIALNKLLFWNEGIAAGRGNYHAHDHIKVICSALKCHSPALKAPPPDSELMDDARQPGGPLSRVPRQPLEDDIVRCDECGARLWTPDIEEGKEDGRRRHNMEVAPDAEQIAELVKGLRRAEHVGRESGADFVGIEASNAKAIADALSQTQAALSEAREDRESMEAVAEACSIKMQEAVQRAERAERFELRHRKQIDVLLGEQRIRDIQIDELRQRAETAEADTEQLREHNRALLDGAKRWQKHRYAEILDRAERAEAELEEAQTEIYERGLEAANEQPR